jgi:hypothetical protein
MIPIGLSGENDNYRFLILRINLSDSRYLLVKTGLEPMGETEESTKDAELSEIPLVKLDPAHPLTLTTGTRGGGQKHIKFPEPSYKLEKLLKERRREYSEEDFDEDDQAIFEAKETPANSQREVIVIEDSPPPSKAPVLDDWEHNAEWVTASTAHLMPPPFEASPSATMALQRELRAMVKEQESATSLKDLGWYMPPDLIGDNLFQWIVELHSFEETLPIAKGMKTACVVLSVIHNYLSFLTFAYQVASIQSFLKFGSRLHSLSLRHSLGLSSLAFCLLFREAVVMSQEVCWMFSNSAGAQY